jgi:hypothetical protein
MILYSTEIHGLDLVADSRYLMLGFHEAGADKVD